MQRKGATRIWRNWNEDYVWRGGQLLATVQPNSSGEFKRHFTLNHLGSPVMVTDGQGQRVARYREAPFGEDMTAGWSQDYFALRFTGHERDYHQAGVLDDLDYMHARHYTPHVGRFLQIDQVLGRLESPQSWNRYAYAANDPVNFVDRDGRQEFPSLAEIRAAMRTGEVIAAFLKEHGRVNWSLSGGLPKKWAIPTRGGRIPLGVSVSCEILPDPSCKASVGGGYAFGTSVTADLTFGDPDAAEVNASGSGGTGTYGGHVDVGFASGRGPVSLTLGLG